MDGDALLTYIATEKSKKIIRDANKAEKDGEKVDWDKVMKDADEASAKTKDDQIKAIASNKK
jgi:hypothetical protein